MLTRYQYLLKGLSYCGSISDNLASRLANRLNVHPKDLVNDLIIEV